MTTALELLHWNDVHGHFDGLARLSARAREIRATRGRTPSCSSTAATSRTASVRLSALTFGVAGWRAARARPASTPPWSGNGGLLRYGPDLLPDYAAALGSAPLVCDLEIDGGRPRRRGPVDDAATPATCGRHRRRSPTTTRSTTASGSGSVAG